MDVEERRAYMRKYRSDAREVRVKALRKIQKNKCTICGKRLQGELHIDHFIPMRKGGGNVLENLQLVHGKCNRWKGVCFDKMLPVMHEPYNPAVHTHRCKNCGRPLTYKGRGRKPEFCYVNCRTVWHRRQKRLETTKDAEVTQVKIDLG